MYEYGKVVFYVVLCVDVQQFAWCSELIARNNDCCNSCLCCVFMVVVDLFVCRSGGGCLCKNQGSSWTHGVDGAGRSFVICACVLQWALSSHCIVCCDQEFVDLSHCKSDSR